MIEYTRRELLKSLMVLSGGVALPLTIDTAFAPLLDKPITPELPAGYVEINDTILKVKKLAVSTTYDEIDVSSMFDDTKTYIPGRAEYGLKFETFDFWREGRDLIGNPNPSIIRVRPAKDIDAVLVGKGVCVEWTFIPFSAEPDEAGTYYKPCWRYRFVSSDTWQWVTG
jgi:hypothetical protein